MQFRSCVSSLIQNLQQDTVNPHSTKDTHSSLKPLACSSLFVCMGMPWDSSFCSYAIDRMRLHISSMTKVLSTMGKNYLNPSVSSKACSLLNLERESPMPEKCTCVTCPAGAATQTQLVKVSGHIIGTTRAML